MLLILRMHNALKAFENARREDTQADTQSPNPQTTAGTNGAEKLRRFVIWLGGRDPQPIPRSKTVIGSDYETC